MKPDEVREQDGDEAALGERCSGGAAVGGRRGDAEAVPHSPQNFAPGGFAAPQDAQTRASGFRIRRRTAFPGLSAPQREHSVTGEA